MRTVLIAIAGLALATSPASAAPCRDSHGKFIKCAHAAATPKKPVRCKDAKGKFISCKAAGAHPA